MDHRFRFNGRNYGFSGFQNVWSKHCKLKTIKEGFSRNFALTLEKWQIVYTCQHFNATQDWANTRCANPQKLLRENKISQDELTILILYQGFWDSSAIHLSSISEVNLARYHVAKRCTYCPSI